MPARDAGGGTLVVVLGVSEVTLGPLGLKLYGGHLGASVAGRCSISEEQHYAWALE